MRVNSPIYIQTTDSEIRKNVSPMDQMSYRLTDSDLCRNRLHTHVASSPAIKSREAGVRQSPR